MNTTTTAVTSVYDRMAEHGHVLLAGVVGSTAYGLAGPDSDEDRLGVFAAPTLSLCGLSTPVDSRTYKQPSDAAFHEAGKYARLALACNPTITELLWLPTHEVATSLGTELVGIRASFLSAKRVRDAYLGYAQSQLSRLQRRGDGTFSSNTAKRSAKHARHMARLVNQGRELYTTGALTVRVEDPDWYHWFSQQAPDVWADWFRDATAGFAVEGTCLPAEPNAAHVEEWLGRVRREHLD